MKELPPQTPQEFYDKTTELKENIKKSYEELNSLYEEYVKENGSEELLILDKNDKEKYLCVYEPEGFLYITKNLKLV